MVSVEGSGACIIGIQGGVAGAFDGKGNSLTYVYFGGHVETNASVSGDITISYSYSMPDAYGWSGYGYSVAGVLGDFGFMGIGFGSAVGKDEKGNEVAYKYISISFGIGKSVIPGQIQFGASYSWQIGDDYFSSLEGVSVIPNEDGSVTITYNGYSFSADNNGMAITTPDGKTYWVSPTTTESDDGTSIDTGGMAITTSDGKTYWIGPATSGLSNKTETTTTSKSTETTNNGSQESTSSNESSNSTSGSSGSGSKIICAKLFRQKLMDRTIYEADEAFGEMLSQKYPIILSGYHFWARPVVNCMKKSKTVTRTVNIIAKPWSYEMAHIMGKREKGDLVGKILMYVGFVICLIIGIITTNAFYINYLILLLIGVLIFMKWQKNKLDKSRSTFEANL